MQALGRVAFVCLAALLCAAAPASDEDIAAMVAQVSQEQYTLYQQAVESMGLGKYGGALYNQSTRGRAWTGNLGDKGNQEARKFIVETFAGFGLKTAVQGRFQNVIAEQTGSVQPENIIVLCAHYDTKKSNTPGGDGDASGVAALLEAARVLSRYKFEQTIRYIAFNASEKRFRGSDDYVFNVIASGKGKLIGAVDVNQILHPYHDKKPEIPQALAVGVGSRGAVAAAWSDGFAAAAAQFAPALPVDAGGPYIDAGSDHFSFVSNGYTAALRLSQNSAKDKANASIGTSADASDGVAGAHYDYGFAANVVRAALAFIARQASDVGPADGSAPAFPDSDGDGFSDEIEEGLKSDPLSAASTPENLPSALPVGNLELIAAAVVLSFASAASDGISISGMLPIPAGFSSKDVKAIVDVGGVVRAFTLKANGAGRKGTNAFVVSIKSTKGIVAAQMARFSCAFAAGNFKQKFAAFGLQNGNLIDKPVTIPITLILANEVRTASRVLRYTAVDDVGGGAR